MPQYVHCLDGERLVIRYKKLRAPSLTPIILLKPHTQRSFAEMDTQRGNPVRSPWSLRTCFQTSQKPPSIVQSIIANELSGGLRHNGFNLRRTICQQIQLSRIFPRPEVPQTEAESRPTKTTNSLLKKSCLKKTENRKHKSPHFILSTTTDSGNELGLLVHRFYWRYSGGNSKQMVVAEIKPGFNTDMHFAFYFKTQTEKLSCKDIHGFYSPATSAEDSAQIPFWHHTLIFLPEDGLSLQLYNMNTGVLKSEHRFADSVIGKRVDDFQDESIIVDCHRREVQGFSIHEFWIAENIPFRFVLRLQVFTPINKKKQYFFVVYDEFLERYDGRTNQVDYYDLKKVMELNGTILEEGSEIPICQVKTLPPEPLFSCIDDYYKQDIHVRHYPKHHFPFVILPRYTKRFEVHEVKPGRSMPLDSDEINFDQDLQVRFLTSVPLRVIAQGKHRIKIFQICIDEENPRSRKSDKSSSRLKVIFDENYLLIDRAEEEGKENVLKVRRRLRNLPRKVYTDEDIALAFDENSFLKQLAVVRFGESSITCFIYDTQTLNLVCRVKPEHFVPRKCQVFDNIYAHFTDYFVAVERKGKKDTSFYVINFLRGQE